MIRDLGSRRRLWPLRQVTEVDAPVSDRQRS
jgi:hypothetical protein